MAAATRWATGSSSASISQAITATLTLSSYGGAVKQIEILFALATGALVFGQRQRVREIDSGAGR